MMADDYVPLEFEEEVVETADVMDLDIDVPDTEINNDTDRCIICKESSSETLSNISQGLNTIRENCDITGRRDILDYLQLMPHDTKHKIHASCRRRIAYEASKVERDKTAALSACKKRQTRSMTGGFVFHKQCFLCGEPCLDSKDMRKVLSGGEFDSSIRDMIQNVRGYDAWALEVQGRLEFVNDLFAVDAIYHSVCLSRFRTNLLHTPHKVKRGRPQNADALHAFERLCERLEAECENELFTLSDLHKMMCELSGDGCEVYGREYFKELLQKRYGSHIYFASRPGRNDVVGFANYCDLLLHDKFFSDLVEGEGSEAEKLVKKAASLILGDIQEMECRRDCYPNASDIKSDGLQFLPPLLKTFMTRLINCPLKQASIGQAIVHAARPRGGVMLPLLFGVAVDVAQCGLNDMQIKLSRLGFSFSVDEIRRYKHSIMNMSCDSSTASDQIPTMHFVADNVDHNVRTLDGLGTFHGMGIISVTSAQGGALVNTHRVSRLEKPIKASEATQNKCVTIFRFNDSTVEGLKGVNLRVFRSLQRPITLPAITNLNLLWHAGTLLRGNMNVRPNWSGFMQSVCQGVHAGVSSVEMLSIVDLNPSDEDCIYSTLLFVANQARRFNIETPNITFDQPLYIKAVDIVMKARLDIVVRLGGFHTLMSFLGSIGHLMKGSGLEEVLGESFVISYQQYQLSTITSVFQDRPPCLEMYRTKITKNVPYHIFLMAAVGCFGMFHYGLMVGNGILIFLNVVGAALQSLYVYLYLSVVLSKSKPLFYLLIAFLYEAVLYMYVFGHLVDHSERAKMIGHCSSLLTTVMLLLPIVEVFENVRNKNADGMPLIMLVGGLACGSCWLVYGLMLNDPNIYAPNIPGILVTLLKLLMIYLYDSHIKSD